MAVLCILNMIVFLKKAMIFKKMKYTLFFICLVALPVISIAQYSLTIEITNLDCSIGNIFLELCDENEVRIRGMIHKINNNKSVIVIENLKPGKYAFKYFHDKNENNKLDKTWIGIPVEGYGFSNNAKGNFGPPDFNKMIFELNENLKVNCSPTYIKI